MAGFYAGLKEVKKVETEDEANYLLAQSWELIKVVEIQGTDSVTHIHYVMGSFPKPAAPIPPAKPKSEYEKAVDHVAELSKHSTKEILDMVLERRKKIGLDFLTDQGALMLVAGDLNVAIDRLPAPPKDDLEADLLKLPWQASNFTDQDGWVPKDRVPAKMAEAIKSKGKINTKGTYELRAGSIHVGLTTSGNLQRYKK